MPTGLSNIVVIAIPAVAAIVFGYLSMRSPRKNRNGSVSGSRVSSRPA